MEHYETKLIKFPPEMLKWVREEAHARGEER